MDTLVQGTNSSSIVSKSSMVSAGYFEDKFVKHFVRKPSRRSPLIHLGYLARALTVDRCIRSFIENVSLQDAQILSLGAGFDTTFFRLCKEYPKLVYFEVDLVDVVAEKINAIQVSSELNSLLHFDKENNSDSSEICLWSQSYNIFAHDLNDFHGLDTKLKAAGFKTNRPTLVFSECAITYMDEDKSADLIKWAAETLPDGAFMNYEQINPDDGFGYVMVEHFNKIQNPLKSLVKYKSLEGQQHRYINAGWTHCVVTSVFQYLSECLSPGEYIEIFKLEPFDEWEEFHLKCSHYSVALASHCTDILKFPQVEFKKEIECRPIEIEWPVEQLNSLQRYGHFTIALCDGALSFGGFGVLPETSRHGRCEEPMFSGKIEKTLFLQSDPGVTLDCLYASCTPIGDGLFIFFGGRTSPKKEVNCNPIMIKVVNNAASCNVTFKKVVLENDSPIPPSRWRHTTAFLNGSVILFGGRNQELEIFNDLWKLKRNELMWRWVALSRHSGNWPEERFSHAAATGEGKLYLSGGLNANFTPLDDVWELDLKGGNVEWNRLIPVEPSPAVYSHTLHYHGGKLISIGGVSDWVKNEPRFTILDIASLHVMHYTFKNPIADQGLMLHGHSSTLNDEEKTIYIYGGGGNCFSFGTHLNKRDAKLNLLRFLID